MEMLIIDCFKFTLNLSPQNSAGSQSLICPLSGSASLPVPYLYPLPLHPSSTSMLFLLPSLPFSSPPSTFSFLFCFPSYFFLFHILLPLLFLHSLSPICACFFHIFSSSSSISCVCSLVLCVCVCWKEWTTSSFSHGSTQSLVKQASSWAINNFCSLSFRHLAFLCHCLYHASVWLYKLWFLENSLM